MTVDAVGPLWDVVVVSWIGVLWFAVFQMRGLWRMTDQRVLFPSLSAPLKTRSTAALAKCTHLIEDWCVALDDVVIVWAVCVAPTLDVEPTA